jgi:protein TonB
MDRAEALKWFGLEAARAEGSNRTALASAFDSIAAAVHPREIGEAYWRASVWARDGNQRPRANMVNLMSVFGATYPQLQREVKAKHPKAAKEMRIEGMVVLDCIIIADGTVGECQVARSLDSVYGLDQEALKAARKWRFKPATVRDRPVPFFVTMELTFKLE